MSYTQTVIDQPVRSLSSSHSGWLHLCNGLDPVRDGGMVPSILGMTGALSRLGGDVTIVTPTPSRLDSLPVETLACSQRAGHRPRGRSPGGGSGAPARALARSHPARGQSGAAARVPYLMAAHGMAEPWALRHKRWKKSLYLALVESRNLRQAACLHALSRPEIGHLRRLAPWTPICFVPNGVDLSFFDDLPSRAVLEARPSRAKGKFVLLFFGRVHVKKGLDLLAEALGRVGPGFPDLHLLVAGKDDDAWEPFAQRIETLGLSERVTYLGHVGGERARQVWAAADAFILPSYSEGFSMAILEALACSLPCLITTACHFPELADAQGAVVVNPQAGEVAQGLRDLA